MAELLNPRSTNMPRLSGRSLQLRLTSEQSLYDYWTIFRHCFLARYGLAGLGRQVACIRAGR